MQLAIALPRVTWAFLVGAGVVMLFIGALTGMGAVAYVGVVLAVAVTERVLKDRIEVRAEQEKVPL